MEKTKHDLLKQEDTDSNYQITIKDGGTVHKLMNFAVELSLRSKDISIRNFK